MKGKAGTIASRPILQRDKDSMIQPTYYGSQRLGTYCNEGSNAQEEAKSSRLPMNNTAIPKTDYTSVYTNSW